MALSLELPQVRTPVDETKSFKIEEGWNREKHQNLVAKRMLYLLLKHLVYLHVYPMRQN